MEIKNLMQQMHNAATEEEKEQIIKEIDARFSGLSDLEKIQTQKDFLESLDEKLKEADELIKKVDIAIEISRISKYVSLSKIASDYFGKSKEWLYQRIKGYSVNGKQATFTEDERKRLSSALEDISRKIHETSLKIA